MDVCPQLLRIPDIFSAANKLTGNGQSTGSGSNIAIYNTHRRLQLLYGKKYGLTYHSQPGEGTEVEIRIPLES